MATPKLAPASIPRTEGPARGLLNIDWSNRPLTANEQPAIRAVMACGKRDSINMIEAVKSASVVRNKISKISSGAMCTDPKKRLAPKIMSNRPQSKVNLIRFIGCKNNSFLRIIVAPTSIIQNQ